MVKVGGKYEGGSGGGVRWGVGGNGETLLVVCKRWR